ncbi:MAG: hypothetical protein JNM37_07845 [Rhodocyclaceae bacterium]|nr:hypothetical protein [Rhodocyclaceae bacterium]
MMIPRTLRATPLALALAAAAGALTAPAHAINLAPHGKGEVLIFPYYTVRNGFDTLVSITNASDRTVLAALRLREANNGRTVGELHLILSPHDMWTGGVTSNGGSGAYLRSFDASCTAPALPAGPSGSKQLALSASGYDGSGALPVDNGGTSLARVQEGFIELIEMGISTVPESTIVSASPIEYASQHTAGVPRDCALVAGAFAEAANFAESGSGAALAGSVFSSFEAPRNVLFGSATLINVGSGHAYDAAPTVIQNFRSGTPIVYRPQAGQPSLANGDAGMSTTLFDRDGALVTTLAIANPVDAVSVVLMADSLSNEYASGGTATSGARTDWVITFPTKHFYTDTGTNGSNGPLPPFSQAFPTTGQSCDRIDLIHADRKGRSAAVPETRPQFATPPSGPYFYHLCSSVNRLAMADPSSGTSQGVLGSEFARSLPLLYSSGVLSVSFPLTGLQEFGGLNSQIQTLRSALLGYTGLPAIGFSVIERNNSAEAGNNRNYGSGRPHAVDLIGP